MPWNLNNELNPHVKNENGTYVCQIYGCGTPKGRRNARMILAAPEMYELLRRVLPRVPYLSWKLRAKIEQIIKKIDSEDPLT